MVFSDYLTQWWGASPVLTANVIARFLVGEIIAKYGTSSYHSQVDGLVERFIKLLVNQFSNFSYITVRQSN